MKLSEATTFIGRWTEAWNSRDLGRFAALFVDEGRLETELPRPPGCASLVMLGRQSICSHLAMSVLRELGPMKIDRYMFDCERPEMEAWFTYGPGVGHGWVRLAVTLDRDMRIVRGSIESQPWTPRAKADPRMLVDARLQGLPLLGR